MIRPDPDVLLARVQREEAPAKSRGHFKLFIGMAPGVGKTYAMLSEAREHLERGEDVVAGVVVTHGRADTGRLAEGFETLPPRVVAIGQSRVEEFDLDAALRRRPALLLVDELAHTNASGSLHPKRWRDVFEILDAGISVFSCLNIQHLESLRDVVAQITGVVVRETVPDHVLERADEIELIDLTPAELRQRLSEGKVYVPTSAQNALDNFFKEGNLLALRELALRRVAERVDASLLEYRRLNAVETVLPAGERVMVCVSSGPLSSRLIRAGRNLASALKAPWWVVSVGGGGGDARMAEHFRLAQSLGATTLLLSGHDVPDAILGWARAHNISKILVGKPQKARWREKLFGSVVDELVRASGEIDVHVVSGTSEKKPLASPSQNQELPLARALFQTKPKYYAIAVLVLVICSSISWALAPHMAPANLTLVYLAGTLFCAWKLGRGPGVLSAILGVATFDFEFVPPFYSFAVSDIQYLFTFGLFLVLALSVSALTARLQDVAAASIEREAQTRSLYDLARELAATRGADNLVDVALKYLSIGVDGEVALFVPRADLLIPRIPHGKSASFASDAKEVAVARWAFDRSQSAGKTTDALPSARGLYLPLKGAQNTVGVLAIEPRAPVLDASVKAQWEAIASQIALALERAQLADQAQTRGMQIESERLKAQLLASVSHDLRTPLASIMGAAGLLASTNLDDETRGELARGIEDESQRLHRLVSNLLDMTRLQNGAVELKPSLQSVEDLVGVALSSLKNRLANRVGTHLSPDLPDVRADSALISQALINLVDNALKYSPNDTPIEIAAWRDGASVRLEVRDRGRGFAGEAQDKVFDPFFRASDGEKDVPVDGRVEGTGLGLAIARAIIQAHGGTIWAHNRNGGGALVGFSLPAA